MKTKIFKFFKKKQNFGYIEKFSSFAQAKNYSDEVNIYFDKRFTKFQGPNKIEAADRFNIISILVSLITKKKLNILDIGEGTNPAYSHIKKLTNISTNCMVLDTEKLVKIIKNKVPKKFKKNIKYITSINEIKLKYLDIVCFNSSIQYLENYENMVKKLSNLNPSYILITFTPFHLENKNYYSLQCSIAGSLHPIIFFSLKNLKKLLFNCNYKPIFENKYMINKHEHKSIGPNKFFFKDLLFKKI